MTKNRFIEILELLKTQESDADRINNLIKNSSLRSLADWHNAFGFTILNTDIIVELLCDTVKDQLELLPYWLYECRGKDCFSVFVNGHKYVSVSNNSELYDAIIKCQDINNSEVLIGI